MVTIVLEEDGTCVDEEEYFQHGLETNCVLMLLKSDETWTGNTSKFGCVFLRFFDHYFNSYVREVSKKIHL